MRIAVVGMGYVGLVTGACFAETGIKTVCYDNDGEKISALQAVKPAVYEPGLENMIKRNLDKGNLSFTCDITKALEKCEVVFLTVDTLLEDSGATDLSSFIEAARLIGRNMKDYLVIANRSTVPVGTCETIRETIQEELTKRREEIYFDLASNPEFFKEGNAIEDFLKPERIVIGVDSDDAEDIMWRLYKPFILSQCPVLFMDLASAEMTKFAANAMLATRISFMNEIANLCDLLGADINLVRKGLGSDSRIGNKFLYAGIGYGGSYFPKHIKALIQSAEEKGYTLNVIKAVDLTNKQQADRFFKKILHHFRDNLKDCRFAVWGLTFKPQTNDTHESPAFDIVCHLLNSGAKVTVYDPAGMHEARKKLGEKIEYAATPYDAADGADALIVLTEWAEFRLPDWNELGRKLKKKVVFDGRNIYEPGDLKKLGYDYYGIGRH